jgi:RNA polymerase sigma-70 factor (ECF subfamily)
MGADLDARVSEPLAAGDQRAAATAVLEIYGAQIHGYLTAVLRSSSAADEAFALFAEDVWRGLQGFRGASSLRTWAYKVAWHAAMRQQRDPFVRRGRRLRTSEASAIAQRISGEVSRQARLEQSDRLSQLREALTSDERALLVLKVDRELKWREIAEVLSSPKKPVDEAVLRKRFERLTEKLRRLAIEQKLLEPR